MTRFPGRDHSLQGNFRRKVLVMSLFKVCPLRFPFQSPRFHFFSLWASSVFFLLFIQSHCPTKQSSEQGGPRGQGTTGVSLTFTHAGGSAYGCIIISNRGEWTNQEAKVTRSRRHRGENLHPNPGSGVERELTSHVLHEGVVGRAGLVGTAPSWGKKYL